MKRFALIFVLFSSPALAQQQPDLVTLQRVIVQLQQQRNAALDALAAADAQVAKLTEELQKAKQATDQK